MKSRTRKPRLMRGGAAWSYPEFPEGGVVVQKRNPDDIGKQFDYDNLFTPMRYSSEED